MESNGILNVSKALLYAHLLNIAQFLDYYLLNIDGIQWNPRCF